MLRTVFILNTHPINRLSKAGAALVNTISSVIVWLELEASNIRSTGFTVDKQTALIYDGYVEPS